jgi:hypothetical protein
MKLLQRTALYQALLALPMVVIGTAIGYGLVRHTVTHEVDEALEDHAILVRDRMLASEQDLEITAPDMLLRMTDDTVMGIAVSIAVVLVLFTLVIRCCCSAGSPRTCGVLSIPTAGHGTLPSRCAHSMLAPSDVEEFAGMAGVGRMMANMQRDFPRAETFTEQAAHELRTPWPFCAEVGPADPKPSMGERAGPSGMYTASE